MTVKSGDKRLCLVARKPGQTSVEISAICDSDGTIVVSNLNGFNPLTGQPIRHENTAVRTLEEANFPALVTIATCTNPECASTVVATPEDAADFCKDNPHFHCPGCGGEVQVTPGVTGEKAEANSQAIEEENPMTKKPEEAVAAADPVKNDAPTGEVAAAAKTDPVEGPTGPTGQPGPSGAEAIEGAAKAEAEDEVDPADAVGAEIAAAIEKASGTLEAAADSDDDDDDSDDDEEDDDEFSEDDDQDDSDDDDDSDADDDDDSDEDEEEKASVKEVASTGKKGKKDKKMETPTREISVALGELVEFDPKTLVIASVRPGVIGVYAGVGESMMNLGFCFAEKAAAGNKELLLSNDASKIKLVATALEAAVLANEELEPFGFVSPKITIDVSHIEKRMVAENAAIETASAEKVEEVVRKDAEQCLSIALAGMSKGFYPNSLRTALADSLRRRGIKNSGPIVGQMLDGALKTFAAEVASKTSELMSQEVTARNAVATLIRDASAVEAASDGLDEDETAALFSTASLVSVSEQASIEDERTPVATVKTPAPKGKLSVGVTGTINGKRLF